MLLETLLQQPGEKVITHIFTRNHITFFKLNGESYCTSAGYVKHHTDPMFDHATLKVFARQEHDQEAKQKMKVMMEHSEYETELWEKHKHYVICSILMKAFDIADNPQALIDFLEDHFTIIPDEKAKLLAKIAEDDGN